MRATEFITENDEPVRLKLRPLDNGKAKAWIERVYQTYPYTMQNNHVMTWGSGDDQQFAMFELTPSFSKRGAVEVKWFQAYPLRQGVGSRAMQELQAMAREDGISLTLYPWDKGQVSQSKLTKFYKGQGFTPTVKGGKSLKWDPSVGEAMEQGTRWTGDEPYRQLVELDDDDLEEGWKQWAAAGALGLGALGAHHTINNQPAQSQQPAATQQVQQTPSSLLDDTEKYLVGVASKSGIKGTELAQFLAQLKHESWDFTKMEEKGGSNYYKKKYDPQFAPKTAKILGNTKIVDGARYYGRGYIQLTGRDNYRMAGSALGLDLLTKPELAADPATAAKIAVWFWQNKTKDITNFADTRTVTYKINPALKGLQDRQANFAEYAKLFKVG